MTTTTLQAVADQAAKHLGESGPNNTCMSNGLERWCAELGIAGLDTDSVTEGQQRAEAGYHGWKYVHGTTGIRVGCFGDWSPAALGNAADRHVCVVDQLQGSAWRGIGSGTPSGLVAYQPRSGGLNQLDVLQGYFVPPVDAVQTTHEPKPKPPAQTVTSPGQTVYTVVAGDSLWELARQHGTSVQAILNANPALPSRVSADFHIARAGLIVIGQRIRIP